MSNLTDDITIITTKVKQEFARRVRVEAALKGTTMSALIRTLLIEHFDSEDSLSTEEMMKK